MRKPSEKEELEGERRLGRGEDQQRRLLKKERRRVGALRRDSLATVQCEIEMGKGERESGRG